MKTDETMGESPVRVTLRRAGQKMLRVDRPVDPAARSDPKAKAKAEAVEGSGSLISLLFKAITTEPSDRRRDHRHPALEPEVWVGWWTGDDFSAIKGRLLNLSRGGAQVVVACRPPRKKSVWVYKDIGSTLASARGEVIGYTPAPGGLYSVRFRFAVPCPTVLYEAAVCKQPANPGGRFQT